MTLAADSLSGIIADQLSSNPPSRIGVAVSGGSDSLALMYLLADWCRANGADLAVVTVDHGLRPAARDEAKVVAAKAAALGLTHETLVWQGWDGQGNLMDRARRARYDLIAAWAQERGLSHVALGHTLDDQAETFLMRLSRAAGVDGLAAMPERRKHDGIYLIRPLLKVTRAQLREELVRRGQDWIEDPTNDDGSFERVRVRKALQELAPLGLDAATLATVAQNMAAARRALNWHGALAARDLITLDMGDVVLERKGWRALNDEVARRLLRASLVWVASSEYGPRQTALAQALEAINLGEGLTLHGCQIAVGKEDVRIFREWNAVRDLRSDPDALWDRRWEITGPWEAGMHVAALGEEALRDIDQWRATKRPRGALISSPAIWKGGRLIAAPVAGATNGWRAHLSKCDEVFFSGLMQ